MEAKPEAPDPLTPAEDPTPQPPLWRRFGVRVTVGVVAYVIVGAVLLASVPDRLLANWFPRMDEHERAAFLGPAANVVLFALGGTIALVGVGLSLSRHRQELVAAERDRQRLIDDRAREPARREEAETQRRIDAERALRERFVTTVKLLSDPAPVNRQAALFALGALADDWDAFGRPDEVQVCIEVLTGYLRAPRTEDMLVPLTQEQLDSPSPSERNGAHRTTAQEVSVKQAGYTVIRNHLEHGAEPHWHDRLLNLSATHIDFDIDLTGATISGGGTVNLAGATVSLDGSVDLTSATITEHGTVNLTTAIIAEHGSVELTAATISLDGSVDLMAATITDGGTVDLTAATIAEGGTVDLTAATITDGGTVDLTRATITDGGTADLTRATIAEHGTVDLTSATITEHGTVDITSAAITGHGTVNLTSAAITGHGTVNLTSATITEHGTVDLATAAIWAHGSVDLERASIGDYGTVNLMSAIITEPGTVNLREAMVSGHGAVDFTGAMISGHGAVNLDGSAIREGGLLGLEIP